jgi:hypothetical protein
MEVNKTHQYLLPCITQTDIIKKIKKIIRAQGGIIGLGIWDTKKEYVPNSIYLLIYVKQLAVGEFEHLQKSIQEDPQYIDDYLYGDYLNDYLHMFVIRCPYPEAYKEFLASRYSRMFDEEMTKKIYPPQTRDTLKYINTARKAILKDPKLKEQLERNFKVTFEDSYELDSRIEFENEIFNYVEGCEQTIIGTPV